MSISNDKLFLDIFILSDFYDTVDSRYKETLMGKSSLYRKDL